MASPLQYSPTKKLERDEGFLHYVAREGRWILRWTMVVCVIAIVVCMVSPGFYFVAVVPALVLLAAYAALVFTNAVERRSDTEAHRVLVDSETAVMDDVMENHAEDDQLAPAQADLVKRETRIGLLIVGAVLLIAVGLAMIYLPWQVTALGAFVLFAYMLLIAAPLWLGWFNDDIELESRRIENKPEPAQVKVTQGDEAAG
jgi:membrane protein implicated in regulation of membrane protease activity